METQSYKRTLAGSVGAGMGALFNASGRTYYILEHKTETKFHPLGEYEKIIVDQVELGRDSSCQIRFDDSCETVSRKHAAIVREGEGWKLIPLSQTNATLVNGQRVDGEQRLNSGDEIRLSSRGPVIGFIVPQGAKSLVKSIGMTERMNLFRRQALRPYKTALTVLSVLLLLAIGGFVAYGFYAQDKVDNLTAEVETNKEALNAAEKKLEAANKIAEEAKVAAQKAQEEADRLTEQADATQEQIEQANNRAMIAQQNARKAQQDLENAKKEKAIAQSALVEVSDELAEVGGEAPVVESVDQVPFAEIADCYNAVYYIKMNDIVIYDYNNKEWARFNTENKIGGTGFLLNDGRFVTARRVIEPWFYEDYRNGVIGYDSKDNKWTYADLQFCVNNGCKVVANCTAYSPSGASFQFKNTDLKMYPLSEQSVTVLERWKVKIETYSPNFRMRSIIDKVKVKTLYWYTTVYRHDWASMAKNDQLNSVKGLLFSDEVSRNPQSGVEVSILGYPLKSGFSDSQSVNPVNKSNSINVSGLNDMHVIELSSRRYQEGNDGAPVLQNIDGAWTVIGVLSHTDTADRDVVTPIKNTLD